MIASKEWINLIFYLANRITIQPYSGQALSGLLMDGGSEKVHPP